MAATTPATRAGLAAITALLACAITGCSSTTVAGRGTAAGYGPISRTASGHLGEKTGGVSLRGLILLAADPSGATVEAIDPHTGSLTGRERFTVPSGVRANQISYGRDYGGLAARSSFNPSLSLVAAQGPQQPDGGAAAGVLDTHGHFTALTAPTSGYGSPKTYVPVGFDPGGRLWYTHMAGGAYTGGFTSVDPAVGPRSTRSEHVSPNVLHVPDGGLTGAVFWIGADGPVDAGAVVADEYLPLPGGTSVAEVPDQRAAGCADGSIPWGWHVGPAGTPVAQTPVLTATNGCLSPEPVPVWPVGPSRFLTKFGSGATIDSATQIYENQIIGRQVRATALLPQSDRSVTSVVADPAGSTAAFISTAGSTKSVYTVPLTGGQPHVVLDLPSDPQTDYTLMDWR